MSEVGERCILLALKHCSLKGLPGQTGGLPLPVQLPARCCGVLSRHLEGLEAVLVS